MNIGDPVYWQNTDSTMRFGQVRILEDRPGVERDDGELIYHDPDKLFPLSQLPDGAHPRIPNRFYHRHPSLSASGAKLLIPPSCPAKYRWQRDNPQPHKPHFDLGSAVHTLVLGEGDEIVEVAAEDWRSKAAKEARDQAHAAGKIPLLSDDYAQALAMFKAVRYHPFAAKLFDDGDAEVSLFTTDPETGVRLKARPDWMTNMDGRLWLIDVKTCADANPATFDRTALKWNYQLQMAWYINVARLLELDESPAFLFLCVEKEPPYLVSVCELDAEAFALGHAQLRQAIGVYKACSDSGDWYGYGDGVNAISLPPWARRAAEL